MVKVDAVPLPSLFVTKYVNKLPTGGGRFGVERFLSNKFYNIYAISSAPQTKSQKGQKFSAPQTKSVPEFSLSWNHYQILMRIENPDERHFYEIESKRQNWGYRWLQRQYASSLYERIALSQDKDKVLSMAEKGQMIEQPSDIIKNPIALEFLGLKPDSSYSESNLENAIISKLETFLLSKKERLSGAKKVC